MTSVTQLPHGERRLHPRFPASTPARITLLGYMVEGRLEDIGAGGVRFTTDDPHLRAAAGNFVRVALDCSQGGVPVTIERAVRVKWVAAAEGATSSREIGLAFDELLDLTGLSFDGS